MQLVPQDTGQAADTVVVLSRGRNIEGDRYNTAISMFNSGRVRQLFVTGRHQSIQVFAKLEQQDLPTQALSGTACARTTKSEAYSAAGILGPQGINQIILITDPPHMLRSWLTFKSLGFSVIPHIEPLPDAVGQSQRSFLAVREYLGLLSYAALGRFNPRSPNTLLQPTRDITTPYPSEQCLITVDRIQQWASQTKRQQAEG
ncbi:YdcF family protein [Egbenema bharatensis]|uniref:YdcF family protein n=1 Tax=Egbenema bharatensis TaxID=3463334 RepID=UPI003A83F0E0